VSRGRSPWSAWLVALILACWPAAAWAQASPSADTYATRYDALRRVTGTIAPDSDGPAGPLGFPAARNTYDPAGRLTRVEKGELQSWQPEGVDPKDWTGFRVDMQVDTLFDDLGRKVRESASGGTVTASVTEFSYDRTGRLKCTAQRMNAAAWAVRLQIDSQYCLLPGPAGTQGGDRITRNTYSDKGDLLRVERAVGTPLVQTYASYTYSPNGKPASVTDANGNRAEMSYDGLDRQKSWIFPSKTVPGETNPADYEEYGYDANANRTSFRKRDGITLLYVYDALNRVTRKIVPASAGGAPGYSVFSGYDNRGLQTYARFGSASGPGVTNSWDGFGRLASSTTNMDGVARTMAGQYDSDGNRILLTGDQGYYAPFSYDGLGRMSAYVGVVRFGYDSAGRRSSLAMGPGSTTSSVTYGYDSVGRLETLTHDLAGTNGDQVLGFAYNPASQVIGASSSNDFYAWVHSSGYARSYEVNGLNQYKGATSTGAAPVAYSYDDNGNLVSDGTRLPLRP
jgi:YD repeat-containing protein